MSFATTVGWWTVSSWLPAYSEALAKVAAEPAGVWGPRVGIVYNIGAILAYVMSGFLADALGRRPFLFLSFLGSLLTSVSAYTFTGDLATFMAIAFLKGVFTPGFISFQLDGDLPGRALHANGARDCGELRVQRRVPHRV